MSDELGLGQREVGVADELTVEELDLLEKAGVSIPLFRAVQGLTNARLTVNATVGGALNVLKAVEEGKKVADPRPVEGNVELPVEKTDTESTEE